MICPFFFSLNRVPQHFYMLGMVLIIDTTTERMNDDGKEELGEYKPI